MEERINGERVDPVAEKAGEKIAIEIETGNSNAIKNIKKSLKAGFDLIISVPVNRRIEAQIRERLRKEKSDNQTKEEVC